MVATIWRRIFVLQFAIQKFKFKIYRTIILCVVLYGCETWSLTFREEHRLRVFERIFLPKRDKMTEVEKTT
jgi:hypothetical protein